MGSAVGGIKEVVADSGTFYPWLVFFLHLWPFRANLSEQENELQGRTQQTQDLRSSCSPGCGEEDRKSVV